MNAPGVPDVNAPGVPERGHPDMLSALSVCTTVYSYVKPLLCPRQINCRARYNAFMANALALVSGDKLEATVAKAQSNNQHALSSINDLALAIPEPEGEETLLDISGPHAVSFGWGDHGRTGITLDTYKRIGLTPRPCFLSLQEQVRIQNEAQDNKHKKKKRVKEEITLPDYSSIPLPIIPLVGQTIGKVCEAACGDRHTLVLTNKGQVWALGDSALGALGNGGQDDWYDPEAEKVMKPKMARRYIKKPPKSTRTVKHVNSTPIEVISLREAGCDMPVHIYAGGFSSYTINGEGRVYAWGENTHGQLGLYTDEEEAEAILKEEREENSKKPSWQMAPGTDPEAEAREKEEAELAKKEAEKKAQRIAEDEEEKRRRALEDNVTVNPLRQLKTVRVPRLVRKLNKTMIKSLACGHRHVLALAKGGGAVYSWGYNNHGQLGLLHTDNRHLPCRVESLRGCTALHITAGRAFSVVVGMTDSHTFLGNKLARITKQAKEKLRIVIGWGENANGQLALGHYDSPVLHPSTSIALASWEEKYGGPKKPKNIVSATAGCFHCLYKDDNGRLLAAGNNRYGQLGLGDLYDRGFPIYIDSIASVDLLSCGSRWSLAGITNGEIYAWGSNSYGELGTGDKSVYLQPELLTIMKDVRPLCLASGNRHNCIIVTDKEDDSKPAFRRASTHDTLSVSEDRRTAIRTAEENEFIHSGICLPAVSEGQYRWDLSIVAKNSDEVPMVIGCCFENADLSADPTYVVNAWTYLSTGEKCFCDTGPEIYGEPYYQGDIIGVEVDRSIGYVRFYRNGIQQGIAYYVNFESDDRDLYLYVGMPGAEDSVTLLLSEDNGAGGDDEEEDEVLICLNEEEDEAKRRAPLQVAFECASCRVHICRACAYQCHGGHSVGLKIQHGFKQCACIKSKPPNHQCISLPEVDSDEEGRGGRGQTRSEAQEGGQKSCEKIQQLGRACKILLP